MGRVYRAHDSRIGRDMAIKVPPADYAMTRKRLRRFEQEARWAPSIINFIRRSTASRQPGQPYLVMELLDGETRGSAAVS